MLTSTLNIPKSDKRLTAAGIGQKGEKVTFYEGELKKYHKKTGKPIKSEKTPVTTGDYWVDYYVDILDKEYRKVMDNIN